MAKKIVETLVTELTADGAKLKAEMEKSFKDAKSWGDRMSKVAKNVAIFGGAGAVGISAGVVALTKNAIDNADAMSKQAQAVGMAIDKLSAYSYAAEMGGVQQEQFVASLGKFNRVIAEAYQGVGKGVDAFDALGISITDNNGKLKNNSDLFAEVADRFKSMPDGIEKSALAMDLFGRSGTALIPTLNGGKESLAEMTAEAERLGLVISEDTGKKAELFNDNLEKMQKAFEGLGNRIAEASLDELNDFTNVINDPATQEGLATFTGGLITFGGELVKFLSEVAKFSGWVGDELAAQINGIDPNDIVRLEQKLAELQDPNNVQISLISGPMAMDIKGAVEARRREIAETKALIDAYYKNQDELLRLQQGMNKPAVSPVGSTGSDKPTFPGGTGVKTLEEINAESAAAELKILRDKMAAEDEILLDAALRKENKEMEDARRKQEAADQEVAIQREKFRRIHEEKLVAQGLDIELENYQHQRAKDELTKEMEALREKGLLGDELKKEFDLAEEEQEIAHQARLQEIKKRAEDEERRRKEAGYSELIGLAETYNNAKGHAANRYTAVALNALKVLSNKERRESINSVTRDGYVSIQKAWASAPFPANLWPVAMATTAAAGNLIGVTGVAHKGMESIPREGSYLLDKGERVVSPAQNRDLTNFLKAPDTSKLKQSSSVNVTIQNFGSPKNFQVEKLSENEVRIIARDEAMQVVQKETGNLVSRDIADPNSKVSKSLARNTQTQRNR